jgi:nucleoside-diphosphate-sugar epimerase
MKSVIITGATGFVGKTLVRMINERFPEAEVLPLGTKDVDLSNQAETFDWFDRTAAEFECDHIIHLAALYKAGDWPVRHPATQFYVNMQINANLLEAWRRAMPKAKMTSILSYCIYPSHSDPHPETEAYGTEPEDYLFAYAFAKKAMIIGQRAYRQEYDMRSTSVVLPTVYGPGDSFAENSHVAGALVGKFVRAARQGAPTVEVWGDGKQEREFIYVEDAADGIIAAALRSEADLLNLGVGEADSIGDIALKIKEAAGFNGEIVFNNDRFVGVKRRVLDISRMRDELGWVAPTSLEDGMARTVRWYESELERETAA